MAGQLRRVDPVEPNAPAIAAKRVAVRDADGRADEDVAFTRRSHAKADGKGQRKKRNAQNDCARFLHRGHDQAYCAAAGAGAGAGAGDCGVVTAAGRRKKPQRMKSTPQENGRSPPARPKLICT